MSETTDNSCQAVEKMRLFVCYTFDAVGSPHRRCPTGVNDIESRVGKSHIDLTAALVTAACTETRYRDLYVACRQTRKAVVLCACRSSHLRH